ncbi:TonB-dependent receptor [uncultured Sphingomonas sp.]|uniref:TonB-dependent receptor n=1 Tax=uncultured Sphingomonas sp. TaxID=158754 RepID=UPI0025FE8DA3|nr:TonB-dependent receptor [uncultured Sphingomonas sp.]
MRLSTTTLTGSLLAGTAAIALAVPASAQTTQEEVAQTVNQPEETQQADIIVTATKRASTVQDVPFSINAQTQEDIERANAQTIEDLSRNIAGLTVQNLGPGQSQVSVRGVSAGQIVRDQPGVKEQVGVYLDESVISLSLFTPDFDLFDLNRVETLRGPQGTLFGSGSVGGTIRYITNQPRLGVTEGVVEANVNVADEDDTGYHLKGAINLPLGDTAALRVVGYGTHFPGFIDAIGPARGRNVNDGTRVGTRVSLLWEPTANIRITPRVVYQKIRADGFNREDVYNFYTNQFTTSQPRLEERQQYLQLREEFKDDTLLADLTGSIDFGGVELTSVTSYINRDILVSRDASALTGSVFISFAGAAPAAAGGAALPSNLRDTTDLKQWAQELRLSSTGDGPFQWVLGGFYSTVDRQYTQRLPTPGSDVFSQAFLDVIAPGTPVSATRNGFDADSPYNANIPYDIKQRAVFGEATYDFGQIKLTAGGRYYSFKETRDFISGGIFANGDTFIDDRTKSNGFSPRGIVTWEPTGDFSVNVQAAKGFRLGGVNDPLNIPLCSGNDAATFGGRPTYDDETLWNYEAGFKYGRGPITFNAAAFYNDIKDLQVTADAGSCSSRVVFNVPEAHAKGVEAELSVRPLAGLDLSFAGSITDAEFDSSVTTADDPATPANESVVIAGIREGNRLPTVPKYQFAVTASYTQRLTSAMEGFITASVQRVGNRFTQPSDQEPGAALIGNALFFDPVTGAFGSGVNDFGSFRLPAYTLVNLSTGVEFDNGLELQLYANNLFDKNPKLSLDRERGARARIGYNVGQPRTIGLTARYRFRSEPAPVAAPPPPPPAPAPATQTCADGSVILATDSCPVPPPPPPPPPAAPERG